MAARRAALLLTRSAVTVVVSLSMMATQVSAQVSDDEACQDYEDTPCLEYASYGWCEPGHDMHSNMKVLCALTCGLEICPLQPGWWGATAVCEAASCVFGCINDDGSCEDHSAMVASAAEWDDDIAGAPRFCVSRVACASGGKSATGSGGGTSTGLLGPLVALAICVLVVVCEWCVHMRALFVFLCLVGLV